MLHGFINPKTIVAVVEIPADHNSHKYDCDNDENIDEPIAYRTRQRAHPYKETKHHSLTSIFIT